MFIAARRHLYASQIHKNWESAIFFPKNARNNLKKIQKFKQIVYRKTAKHIILAKLLSNSALFTLTISALRYMI